MHVALADVIDSRRAMPERVVLSLVLVAAVGTVILLRRAGFVETTVANVLVVALIVLGVGFGFYRSRREL